VAQIQQRERTFDQTVLAARVVEHAPTEQQNSSNAAKDFTEKAEDD
ncbi:130_t:CDS:2, partial [Acaulospora morrowiae]